MDESRGGSSYGGRFAGGDFDAIEFLKRPQTIVRLISWVFAIIVFGCISDGCYDPGTGHCLFHKDANACNYGIGIGVIAFLACIIFLVADASFENISNAELRKKLVLADLAGLTSMAFMRHRKGTDFDTGIPGETRQSPYASFPEPEDDQGFQSQPFGGKPQQPVTTEYNVPSY
eukprot:gene9169-16838_t